MYLVVEHCILSPKEFSDSVKECLSNIPQGIKIHKVLPGTDKAKAFCLWEASDLDFMKIFLEGYTGDFSNNHYMVVDEKSSIGI
jgi:hypothetical protein